jgi:predicted metal-dependent hydrolase
MSQKVFILDGVGEVLVAKRRGTRNIRLSIKANGQVRVGIPAWMPYATGLAFAKGRQDWIVAHQATAQPLVLKNGDRIGKSHRLKIVRGQNARISTRVSTTEIVITAPQVVDTKKLQAALIKASERALKKEAETLLVKRTNELAGKYDYSFKAISIKKLSSRWGSCSSDMRITLNYFLMQLPWELIDYVILHELVHTKHLNHSRNFWNELKQHIPDARQRQKQVKAYRPAIFTS